MCNEVTCNVKFKTSVDNDRDKIYGRARCVYL